MASADHEWVDLGDIAELDARFQANPLQEFTVGSTKLAVSRQNGTYGAVSGVCNHLGGPLGKGTLDGDYVVCPWHYWKFHRLTGQGEPGYEADCVPQHAIKVEKGRLW